ncbi:glycerate kinase [Brochothrix thermosphacta]|uniref:Glycerate 2-kinase n=1 Tax=Brochothrix thermosphacta TaxID=2756 RepID=A0A1D2L5K2_BROTH|nr:glycerate kinase [Brochothrix thermosphacta]SLN04101.1 Glycerate kinase [Brachybacterium faecium]ATF26861.1 glycerate kinase [Brochothrix thermosphacta]ATH86218.1 glycerate kinase [Brochothrix thermosphacta]ODJ65243.1 hypothetical protein BFR36_08975 [Brochothrix thermosphacta]ODJ72964.1 hypothetical protein BFR39_11980 [Brochothrix thermosphacta]
MNIIIAMDSMKSALTSEAANRIIADIVTTRGHHALSFTMADGGEGTAEAFMSGQSDGEWCHVVTVSPAFKKIEAKYGWVPTEKTAYIDVSAASGIQYASADTHPLNRTSAGTGHLMRDALDKGAQKIVLGLGGSATIDGGIGLVTVLGGQFFNRRGERLQGCGADLGEVAYIDLSLLDKRLANTTIIGASDVTNPLIGENGAVRVFGAQKGLLPDEEIAYDEAMQHYLEVATGALTSEAGDGAAGGIGFALRFFLKGQLQSGATMLVEANQLQEALETADLLITGEGRMDSQSLMGKLPITLARQAKAAKVPVIAFVGGFEGDVAAVASEGIRAVVPIVQGPVTIPEAISAAATNLAAAVERTFILLEWE